MGASKGGFRYSHMYRHTPSAQQSAALAEKPRAPVASSPHLVRVRVRMRVRMRVRVSDP